MAERARDDEIKASDHEEYLENDRKCRASRNQQYDTNDGRGETQHHSPAALDRRDVHREPAHDELPTSVDDAARSPDRDVSSWCAAPAQHPAALTTFELRGA